MNDQIFVSILFVMLGSLFLGFAGGFLSGRFSKPSVYYKRRETLDEPPYICEGETPQEDNDFDRADYWKKGKPRPDWDPRYD